jgi:hypothetical protein
VVVTLGVKTGDAQVDLRASRGSLWVAALFLACLLTLATTASGSDDSSGELNPERAAAAEKLSARAEHDPALIQRAYELDAQLVSDDFVDNDTLTNPELSVPLELHEWAFMDQWLLQQSAQRTPANAHDYEEIVSALDPTIQVVAVDLQSGTTLISTVRTGIGHVVIVTRQGTKPPQLWDIVATLPAQVPDAYQLGCWRPMPGVRPCYTQHIGLLPNDASGAPRFYIEAGYAQVAGATTGHQLSIWRWNGEVATPLYVTSFAGIGDAPQEGVHVAGDTIRIVQKDQWTVLDPCGACDGRQVAQLLRLTSRGVSDEGTVSLTPELDLVDAIYTKFRLGQAADALATPAVLQFMRQLWVSNRMEDRNLGFMKMLFMNVPQTVTQKGDTTQLCFRAYYGIGNDSMTATLFTFARQGSQLHIVDAQQNAAGCMSK